MAGADRVSKMLAVGTFQYVLPSAWKAHSSSPAATTTSAPGCPSNSARAGELTQVR